MKQLRIILWVAVALAAIAAGILLMVHRPSQPETTSSEWKTSLGGPFTLVSSDGKPFSSTRLTGKPFAIFFGFTNCPDVCPTTLSRLVRLRKQTGSANSPEIVFVTVDPERDGPTEVGRYAQLFGAPVIGLTGTPEQIERVKKQFGIFSQKHAGDAGSYTVDHTATVLLFDEAGRLFGTIAPDEPDSTALEKMKRLQNEG